MSINTYEGDVYEAANLLSMKH